MMNNTCHKLTRNIIIINLLLLHSSVQAASISLFGAYKSINSTLTSDGKIKINLSGEHGCRFNQTGENLCPSDLSPGQYSYTSKLWVNVYSSNGAFTNENGSKNWVHEVGTHTLYHDTDGNPASWPNQWVTREVALPQLVLPLTTTKPPGTYTDQIMIFTTVRSTKPTPIQDFIWAGGFANISITYKVQNGKPVPPDTPDPSCSTTTSAVNLTHGSLTTTGAGANETTATISLSCPTAMNGTFSLSSTARGATQKLISLTGGGTTNLDFRVNTAAWSANNTYTLPAGASTLTLRSTLQDVPAPGSHTGHDILTMTYN
ncbi:hypothetical protein [Salmonella enterica]|uniref:hypothetical protein n=1 Tax=Salmonella enterica TaxID=28901 RepID=UPI001118DBCE|nr:hypothetical protein [Salmonella enterica]